MPRNPFLTVALNGRRFDLQEKRSYRTLLMSELSEVAFLRNFINTWANSSYQAAVDSLPDDDPATTDVNESVSVDDIKELAGKLFGSGFDFPDSDGEADAIQEWLEENKQMVKERIFTIYGKVRAMDMDIGGIETDIKNLEAIQKNDGKEI
ncbi:MAG: hypothetical protein HYR97_02915 [Candidatus Melainabacteria bacterium]|nr:hypothetical protein [Candidatus Melainabacteria bacterium]MBI3309593.1 hypothetical protein [Candidatus Melainabacteria bacterium]